MFFSFLMPFYLYHFNHMRIHMLVVLNDGKIRRLRRKPTYGKKGKEHMKRLGFAKSLQKPPKCNLNQRLNRLHHAFHQDFIRGGDGSIVKRNCAVIVRIFVTEIETVFVAVFEIPVIDDLLSYLEGKEQCVLS